VVVAALHFLLDADRPYAAVHRRVAATPPGSYLVISHATNDFMPPGIVSVADWRAQGEPQPRPSPAETAVYGAVARIR
jgi:S-adenosyl methyltransferase